MYLKHLMYHYMQAKHYLTGVTNIIFLKIYILASVLIMGISYCYILREWKWGILMIIEQVQ